MSAEKGAGQPMWNPLMEIKDGVLLPPPPPQAEGEDQVGGVGVKHPPNLRGLPPLPQPQPE